VGLYHWWRNLGYAQFPGGASSTDGVVVDSKYFGLSGSAAFPYNLGRTDSRSRSLDELRHIWGDATCGSDLVSDTPTHNTANYGVPAILTIALVLVTSRNDYELHGLH
jgi:hypothetical protein